MFRPVPMSRLACLVLVRDERAVLQHLGNAGVMQLTRDPAGPDTAPLIPVDRSREVARCDGLLARVDNLQRSLDITSCPLGPVKTPEISIDAAENKLDLLEARAGELLRRRQSLKEEGDELNVDCKAMSAYRGLQIPLGNPDNYSFLHFVTGRMPLGNLEKMEVGDHAAVIPLPEQNGWQPVVAMAIGRHWNSLEGELQKKGFQKQLFPIVENANLDDFSEMRQRDQAKIAGELDELNAQLRVVANEIAKPLAEVKKIANLERQLWNSEQNFPQTEQAILLTGWIPSMDVPVLEQQVRRITGGRCVLTTSIPTKSKEERIPILLRHPWPFRPFELLVSAYGLPDYWDFEPTVFVALSYVLMFGMMFGDVGDGAILAIAGFIMLFRSPGKGMRDAGFLLSFCGVSSIAFGAVYGSCFGIPGLKKYALWHDPLEGDTMNLMIRAVEIGIVMISLGLVLNILNRFRRGDVVGAFLGKFGLAGLFFYLGTLALVLNYKAFQSRGLSTAAFVLVFVLPLIGWLLKEPLEHFLCRAKGRPIDPNRNWLMAGTESIVDLFEGVISYLSNTISFVRLAAYCMSHAALLMATFAVAASLRHLSLVGGPLSLLVIVLGNLLALVLEGIVASVQALRLEYYEFFGKFFFGTGQPFKPFCLSGEPQAAST
jgi:V/A-type H+-transporting ATPase subunit I